jgi:hypothetical protein
MTENGLLFFAFLERTISCGHCQGGRTSNSFCLLQSDYPISGAYLPFSALYVSKGYMFAFGQKSSDMARLFVVVVF